MEEEGIIRNYYTCIDSYKLGYFFYRFYIKYQYVSSEMKEEIIQHFAEYHKISTIGSLAGLYDLILVFWVDDPVEFYSFWEASLAKYGEYFSSNLFTLYIKGYGFPKTILIDTDNYTHDKKEPIETFGIGKKVKIDETDYNLLNELAVNARMPSVDLAKRLDCSSQTINYRIKNLTKKGIIQSFRTNIDLSQIGLKRFKVDIHLKNHDEKKNIMKTVRQYPNLLYISNSLGLCDIECEMMVKDRDALISIFDEIMKTSSDSIRNYDYYSDYHCHKETFLPELTKKDFKKK